MDARISGETLMPLTAVLIPVHLEVVQVFAQNLAVQHASLTLIARIIVLMIQGISMETAIQLALAILIQARIVIITTDGTTLP